MIYKCRYIETPIVIDGNYGKNVWGKAEPLQFHIPVTNDAPLSKTEAGLLWDHEFLYVCFRAYDQDIFAYSTERDSETYRDDVLEIFFKTVPENEPYYNFEINALNTVYDAYNIRRATAGSHYRWRNWDCRGLHSKVSIQGTLNNPSDRDLYWGLEVAIPFSQLEQNGKKYPQAGDQWKFHLSRYDYSIYLEDGVELSSSALLTEVNFHKYEDWDLLEFVR